jgi:hypothetical protein
MKTLEGKKGGKSSAEYSKLATDFRNLNKSISA